MATVDLDKILPVLEENSKTVRNTYISYLAAATFIWITIESVTHRMLLIPDERLTLPVIQVQIPVVGFFAAAPALVLMFQLYFQIHVYHFARDLARERDKLWPKQIQDLKIQLPGNLFTWKFLETKNRKSIFEAINDLIVSLTFYWYGAFVLLRVQWVFLPHHYEAMTTWHRTLVFSSVFVSTGFALKIWALSQNSQDGIRNVIDLIINRIKIIFDSSISHPGGESYGWEKFRADYNFILGSLFSFAGLYFFVSMSMFLLVIPLNKDENERPFSNWTWLPETILVCTQQSIFSKEFSQNLVLEGKDGKPISLEGNEGFIELEGSTNCQKTLFIFLDYINPFSNKEWTTNRHFKVNKVLTRNLELPEAKLARAPSDTIKAALMSKEGKKLSKKDMDEMFLEHYGRLNLKDRHLEFANFGKSDLRKADLRGAQLNGANLWNARLQGAILWHAQLQGAILWNAQLQGADLGSANLQGADLGGAQLQGADLTQANMTKAKIEGTHLEGANLKSVQLQHTPLLNVFLEAATLNNANLKGVFFGDSHLEAADLSGANLEAANLKFAFLEGAEFYFFEFDKIQPQFPLLSPKDGKAPIAYDYEGEESSQKIIFKNKEKMPPLVEIEKIEAVVEKWEKLSRDFPFEKNLEKKHLEKRKKQLRLYYEDLFRFQRSTWERLLCQYPSTQKQLINKKRRSENWVPLYEKFYFPHRPFFSREGVQEAIDRCDKQTN